MSTRITGGDVPKDITMWEMVDASTVVVGDRIHFPNSRQPQVVTAIEESNFGTADALRFFHTDGTSKTRWGVSSSSPVRKVKAA